MIETERLVLRPWREDDAAELYELARDPAIGPAAGWQPHASVDESRQIIRDVLAGWESYAMTLRASSELVGAIGLKNAQTSELCAGRDDEFELGYWTGRPFWGRGYMPEAAQALIEHARCDLGATRMWGRYYAGNKQSRRVMEKCGLTYVRTDEHVACPLLGDDVFRDEVVMVRDLDV